MGQNPRDAIYDCGGVIDGKRCTRKATTVIGDTPLCPTHRQRVVFALEAPRFKDRETDRLPSLHVVYYFGDPNAQQVKIGTSANLHRRFCNLRRGRPGLVVLVTEPGSLTLERRRHKQFGGLRHVTSDGETEWFRKEPTLMDHISAVRSEHGILSSGLPLYRSWIAPLKGAVDGPSVYVIDDPKVER